MTIGSDVKKAFRSSKCFRSFDDAHTQQLNDGNDKKARHILGLDTAYVASRNHSVASSTSTSKPRVVTFSDATTAAVSIGSVTDLSEGDASKGSSEDSPVLLKQNCKADLSQLKASTPNLSYYDKSRAPLSVSQQTSDSSSRDFGLRKDATPVISVPSQQVEHHKQLRSLTTSSSKMGPDNDKRLSYSVQPDVTTSSRFSIISVTPGTADSVAPSPAISRISTTRGSLLDTPKSMMSKKRSQKAQQPSSQATSLTEPTRAKINVRRPKVGTKNWFDNLESDSSEDEDDSSEPQLYSDLALEVKTASVAGRADKHPPRCSSKRLAVVPEATAELQAAHDTYTNSEQVQQDSRNTNKPNLTKNTNKTETSLFAKVDLTVQSVLSLSSSDDEEDDNAAVPAKHQELARKEIRASLMSTGWESTDVEYGQALAVNTKKANEILQERSRRQVTKPAIPNRAASRFLTYLDDKSTETLTRNKDIITSFPSTPTEASPRLGSAPAARTASGRESVVSDNESVVSTKLMTVTRQEENLIAAMRLRRIAMKRAQAAAHRAGALRVLDANNARSEQEVVSSNARAEFSSDQVAVTAARRMSYLPPAELRKARRDESKSNSVTTIQTESTRQPSARSSVVTYLSEGSEDLQLPYSSLDRLSLGSSVVSPKHRAKAELRRGTRDTFLSETTTDSALSHVASPQEQSPKSNGQNRHVMTLDPLERQLLRDEIPSQLFLESPFLGWEARANIQVTH
ncbi:hypothetical protein LTR64_001109 [Lithohypha guttulata]|uniref:uncharacterized protein n=1 Tax=Lithohypha guttulata TaxID=1690604 RepID=UPI002DDE9BD2|nr:hypothetical protein LTR51_003303 [Lithohypha guttulata]